jgi:hypothetical protein
MLGRRKSMEIKAVAAIREEMSAADMRARAVLSNAMALIELRLSKDAEERERIQATTEAAIESLRTSIVDNANGVGRVLEQVANMCAMVAEQIEADRVERRALADAITLLARPLSGSADTSRVIGGTVLAVSGNANDGELSRLDQAELSLLDRDQNPADGPDQPSVIDLEQVSEGAVDERHHKGTRLTAR